MTATLRPSVSHYFVCFHSGAAIGTYGTMRAAILAAEGEARMEKRVTNIYPVHADGRKGERVGRAVPHRLPSGSWEIGLAFGEASRASLLGPADRKAE
jgi:hypothetical protein